MNTAFEVVTTLDLTAKPTLCDTDTPKATSLQSPAISLMDNYGLASPLKVSDEVSYDHVQEILADTHSQYLLVEDSAGRISGLVGVEHVTGIRSMIRAQERQQRIRELNAGDLMEAIDNLPTISLKQAMRAKLGDLVATFEKTSSDYVLVMDPSGQSLRGLFSARAISRNLKMPINPGYQARSVADIALAITGEYKRI